MLQNPSILALEQTECCKIQASLRPRMALKLSGVHRMLQNLSILALEHTDAVKSKHSAAHSAFPRQRHEASSMSMPWHVAVRVTIVLVPSPDAPGHFVFKCHLFVCL